MPTATRVPVSPRLSSSPRPPVTQSQVALAHFEDARLNVPSTAVRHLPPRKDVIWCSSTLHTPSIAFRHLPPNSAKFSYATEGALSVYLSAAVHGRGQRPPKGSGTDQTPSTGLRHPSFEGAGKRCSECASVPHLLAASPHSSSLWPSLHPSPHPPTPPRFHASFSLLLNKYKIADTVFL